MDLHLEAEPEVLVDVFRSLGFTVTEKRRYYSATKKARAGRLHGAFLAVEDGTYCDFHFDFLLHFLMFGVDYRKRPQAYFERRLRAVLQERRLRFRVDEVSWFTRRNRAVFRGFRL